MKCLVSGATGFIGRELSQQLLARGETVIALSRTGTSLPDGTATRAIDLASEMPAPGLLQGVDVVYHLAGIAHRQAQASAYTALNERATVALARLAAGAGARCFVFLSSVKAMGACGDSGERAEDDCALPTDPYGLSKWRAECALRAEFGGGSMAVVILRPALVYGPAAKGNIALLARAVRAGLPRPPEGGGRSMVALDDLVELLYAAPRCATPGVQTWIAADGRAYSTRFIYDQLRRASGRGAGRAWLPVPAWRLAAALLDLIAAPAGESTWDRLFGSELYSNRAVLAATGWRPRARLEDLAEAIMATGSSAT